MRAALRVLAGLAGYAWMVSAAADFNDQERAGQRLFRDGVGASGQLVSARVGAVDMPVPGSVVPCANCHGRDGQGRTEAGVAAPSITWSELTKSYGHRHENGRTHQPFDADSFLRAVTLGRDPAGQRLDPAMPRFALGRDDQDNLLAYLKRLEDDHDPGVAGDRLRIGTALPLSGALADSGRLARRVIEAYFADLNDAGGLYGRRLELVVVDAGVPHDELAARGRSLLEGDVLALLAPLAPGGEPQLLAQAESRQLPVIGPLGASAGGDGLSRTTFFVQSGLRELVRSLASHAGATHAGRPVLVLAADDPAHEALATALRRQCERSGCGALTVRHHAPGGFELDAALRALRESRAEAVFFLAGEPELEAFLRGADAAGLHPDVLLPGALGARVAVRAPEGFDGRIVLAYPSAPGEALRAGSRFEAFRVRHGLPASGVATQAATYAACALLAEGLRRSGRSVGRDPLVRQLEALRDFRTDAVPPLSYGPDRRVGALGGHLVTPASGGLGFRTVNAWLPLD